MKLVRWTLAGASFYVIYKYAIGKKAKDVGEDVFAAPEPEEQAAGQIAATPKPKAKRTRKPKA